MKRVLLLFSLMISITVSAQTIQDTFFGQKLGVKTSESSIKKGLEGKVSTNLSVQTVYPLTVFSTGEISFGGVRWETISFYCFFEDLLLGNVVFSKVTYEISTLNDAKKTIQDALTKKYGEPEKTADNMLEWFGENGISISLSVMEQQRILGTKEYSLMLGYNNLEVLNKYRNHISDEL